MAQTQPTKCFICKVPGFYGLRFCNDGKSHKICDHCAYLCKENNVIMLDNGVAQTIAAKETWITVQITEHDNVNHVLHDVDLSVPTAELSNKVQWFLASVLDRYFNKEHNSPNVMVKVFTWQNFRFQCPAIPGIEYIDHCDMVDTCKWYAQEYVKEYYTGQYGAINSPSMQFGKTPQTENGLYFQAKNMQANCKDFPFIKYYFDHVYMPFFVECYNTAVENYRIHGTAKEAVNFSLAQAPLTVRKRQGMQIAEQATERTFVTFSLAGKTYRQAMFAENIAVQGGILVWHNDKHVFVKYEHIINMQDIDEVTLYATSYDTYLEPGTGKIEPLTRGQKFDLKKSWAMSANRGDIVNHWQGGCKVKSVFISAHANYCTVQCSYGEDTVSYMSVISIEPGTDNTPDDNTDSTPASEQTEQSTDASPFDFDADRITADSTEQTPDDEINLPLPVRVTIAQTPASTLNCTLCSASGKLHKIDIALSSIDNKPYPYCEMCMSVFYENGVFNMPVTLATAEQSTPAYTVKLISASYMVKALPAKTEIEAHEIARANVGAWYPVTHLDKLVKINLVLVYDSNELVIGEYKSTPESPRSPFTDNVPLSTIKQSTPASEQFIDLPTSLEPGNLTTLAPSVHTFKRRKTQSTVDKIRKNALKNTSRFLALFIVGFLAVTLVSVLSTGTSHAQTNTGPCKVYAYKHKPGYYMHTWQGTVSNLTSIPNGCVLVTPNSSVVATSTPSTAQSTPTSTGTTKHARKSSKTHKKHTRHHAVNSSAQQTAQSTPASNVCKYTFDDSDTGTHKRTCQGVSIVIKIND